MSAADERDMDRPADQLAEGRSLRLVAIRLNISPFRAEFLFARICIRLGPQAS